MSVPLPTPDGPQMMSGCSSLAGGVAGSASLALALASPFRAGAAASLTVALTSPFTAGAAASAVMAAAGAGRLAKRPGAGTGVVSASAAFGGALGTISRFSAKPNLKQKASYCSSTSLSFVFRKFPAVTSSRRCSSGAAPSSTASSVRLSSASLSMQRLSVRARLLPRSSPSVWQTSLATRSLLKVSQTPSQARISQSPRCADHS
mmetsp:Transcript_46120/g.147292  ORF Transcript_46120/g.147292 Transcript_46120/m.147292 type:complete len:205 (-) Transcript_46120:686-1300(-)